MTELELVDLLKIYPFQKVSGVLGRKKKAALLEKQRAMPYTTNEGVIALQHVSAKILPGEFVVLLGPSGCGKTTLIRLIAGLDEPTLGEVRYDGKITKTVADETLRLLQVDEVGLDRTDRSFLRLIIENYGGGPVGLETLSAAMGEDSGTMEDVCEPYLLQNGFIKRTPRGRMATAKAYRHLGIPLPAESPHVPEQMSLFDHD